MQQRLQIARCLAQEPAILLMDEPFGALDAHHAPGPAGRGRAPGRRPRGLTVLFVTHDLEEAIYLGDRVIALRANPRDQPGAAIIDVPLARPRDQLSTREERRIPAAAAPAVRLHPGDAPMKDARARLRRCRWRC